MNTAPSPVGWTGRDATVLRRALGLTAERFADRVGVSTRTVVNWSVNPDTVPWADSQNRLDAVLDAAPATVRDRFLRLTGRSADVAPVELLGQVLTVLTDIHRSINKLMEAI